MEELSEKECERIRQWYIMYFRCRLKPLTSRPHDCIIFKTKKERDEYANIHEIDIKGVDPFLIVERNPRALIGIHLHRVLIYSSDFVDLIKHMIDKINKEWETPNEEYKIDLIMLEEE